MPAVQNDWLQVGAVTGVLFGVGFGSIGVAIGAMPEVGAIIGMPTLLGGLLLHMTLSLVSAIVFAAILSTPHFSRYADRVRTLVPLGLAFGVLQWIVLDTLVLAYLATSFAAPGAVFPNVSAEDLVFTLVLGVAIALTYYVTRRWIITRPVAQ